jgi:peptide/nickel transport system permease protein
MDSPTGVFSQLKSLWQKPLCRLMMIILLMLYGLVFLAPWIAPYDEHWADPSFANAPPISILLQDPASHRWIWPSVPEMTRTIDRKRFKVSIQPKPAKLGGRLLPIKIGATRNGQWKLFSVDAPGRLCLLGTDTTGRDWLSRMLYGGRVSLTIGFFSLLVTMPLGLAIGGMAGLLGGWVDYLLMRLAEVVMAIPSLFLLLALAASLPADLSSSARFMGVTIILALIGWPGLARIIRGLVLAIKAQPFIDAGRTLGLSTPRLMLRHVLPQTLSTVIVIASISVPGYILAESGLSFLGLGIQQPDASWGNLLKEAQSLTNILERPWMMTPAVLIALAVLAFNTLGDSLRDQLDPTALNH